MPATSRARRGGEKEEPNEPQPEPLPVLTIVPDVSGYVRIINGKTALETVEIRVKEPYYHYNSMISSYGYFIKPVHKVYKVKQGRRLVYVYYGRYWFRRGEKGRAVYAGSTKPSFIPFEPPSNPLEGVTIIIDGPDLLVSSTDVDKIIGVLSDAGFKVAYSR
ncbi:MAG: hypothetical protein F7C35_00485 [Desulfurococcales archaeon]|nr:hypothetical protein [Desulfurococcales archaeon]